MAEAWLLTDHHLDDQYISFSFLQALLGSRELRLAFSPLTMDSMALLLEAVHTNQSRLVGCMVQRRNSERRSKVAMAVCIVMTFEMILEPPHWPKPDSRGHKTYRYQNRGAIFESLVAV
jgi:hypothetical protein